MRLRQQSTTLYPILFYMVQSSDHLTPATGLAPTVTLSKNGAAFGAAAGAVASVGNGWYSLAGNAVDRNTLGTLALRATATGADETALDFTIVPWDPFDATRLGLTALPNAAAGAAGGLGVLDANANLPANVRRWRDEQPAVLASGFVRSRQLPVGDRQPLLAPAAAHRVRNTFAWMDRPGNRHLYVRDSDGVSAGAAAQAWYMKNNAAYPASPTHSEGAAAGIFQCPAGTSNNLVAYTFPEAGGVGPGYQLKYRTSSDLGATWSAAALLPFPTSDYQTFAEPTDYLLSADHAQILIAVYGDAVGGTGEFGVNLYETASGTTWTKRSTIFPYTLEADVGNGLGVRRVRANYTALIRFPDGRLLAVADAGLAVLATAYSDDDGVTWSTPQVWGPGYDYQVPSGIAVTSDRALLCGRVVQDYQYRVAAGFPAYVASSVGQGYGFIDRDGNPVGAPVIFAGSSVDTSKAWRPSLLLDGSNTLWLYGAWDGGTGGEPGLYRWQIHTDAVAEMALTARERSLIAPTTGGSSQPAVSGEQFFVEVETDTPAAGLTLAVLDQYGGDTHAQNQLADRFDKRDVGDGRVLVSCDTLPEDFRGFLRVTATAGGDLVGRFPIATPKVALTGQQRPLAALAAQGFLSLGERRVLIEQTAFGYPSYPKWIRPRWVPAPTDNTPPTYQFGGYNDYDGLGTPAGNGGPFGIYLTRGDYPGTKVLDKNNTGLGAQPQNWSIGQRADGQLVLIFTCYDGSTTDVPQNQRQWRYRLSSDNGVSWGAVGICTAPISTLYPAGPPPIYGSPMYGAMLLDSVSGHLLQTIYGFHGNASGVSLLQSLDGITWTLRGTLSTPSADPVNTTGFDETDIAWLPSGRLLAAAGPAMAWEGLGTAYSDDRGATWSPLTGHPGMTLNNPTLCVLSEDFIAVFGRKVPGSAPPWQDGGAAVGIIDRWGAVVQEPLPFDGLGYYYDGGYIAIREDNAGQRFVVYYADLYAGNPQVPPGSWGHPTLVERPLTNLCGLRRQPDLTRVLGLSQDCWVLDNTSYGAGGDLTAATIYIYDTAAHATAHDGVTGLRYKYALSATYGSGNRLTRSKQVRLL